MGPRGVNISRQWPRTHLWPSQLLKGTAWGEGDLGCCSVCKEVVSGYKDAALGPGDSGTDRKTNVRLLHGGISDINTPRYYTTSAGEMDDCIRMKLGGFCGIVFLETKSIDLVKGHYTANAGMQSHNVVPASSQARS